MHTPRHDRLEVEWVCQNSGASRNGISRYTRELDRHLTPHISIRKVKQIYSPLTSHIDVLRYFPLGIRQHHKQTLVHFTEDFGCSQMLWNPLELAVATSHDLGFLAWPPEARMHRALDRLFLYLSYLGLKRMKAVIAVSEYSRQTLTRQLGIPADRVFTVYSGNDNDHFKPVAQAREKLSQRYAFPNCFDTKILLYVGAEFPRKNLSSILRALKLLPPNVQLLKVGPPGGERFRVHTRAQVLEHGVEDRVCFFDEVPEEDLPLFYSAADVYVCLSFLEGFGHPVVEAMACGTPVVCSNAASLPEIAGDAALFVPPEEIAVIVDAIQSVMNDRGLSQNLRERGFKQAAVFSWTKTARKVSEIYRLVVEGMHVHGRPNVGSTK